MTLDVLIEGLLFYMAAPQKKKKVMEIFAVGEDEFQGATQRLTQRLQSGALRLLETVDEIQLVTAPELAEFIESLRKNELSQDIGKAGAETLAIILYREPVTRAEIDRIRGVNSAFILRNLLTRGLIERQAAKNTYEFRITPQLLQHLGVTHKHELPQFGEFMERLDTFTNEPTPDTV